VRTLGGLDCDIYWQNTRSAGSVDSPGGVEVLQPQLNITFKNRKDIPVTVRSMRVELYRGDKPLDKEERPDTQFTREPGGQGPFELVNLPPRIPVSRTIIVDPGHNQRDKQRAVKEADRVGFQATIDAATEVRIGLAPWDTLEAQPAYFHRPWWRDIFGGSD
jgi:hypothetical protein